jgi:serine/threonine protein kinase
MSARVLDPGTSVDVYEVKELIGHGGYADVYLVRNMETGIDCALKLEKRVHRVKGLDIEQQILEQIQGSPRFPIMYGAGRLDELRYIVMEAAGPSVSSVLSEMPSWHFSLSTALRVGLEMLGCIEEFHRRGFIVRDVKPDNFLIRWNQANPILLIDYGLARRHIDAKTGKPIPAREKECAFVGTPKYCSPAAHRLEDLGRKDDIVSWWYSLVDMVKGELPWSRMDREQIFREKTAGKVGKKLMKQMPVELERVWDTIAGYAYEDEPDYELLRSMLARAIEANGFRFDAPFDWERMFWEEETADTRFL